MLQRLLLALLSVPLLAGGARSAGDLASVARPHLQFSDQKPMTQGLVFFLRVGSPPGIAAVGTAHAFELADLVEANRVDFTLGRSTSAVASSNGLLVAPGRPFNAPGASLKDDYAVYALAARPEAVSALEAEREATLELGARVRMLGIPPSLPQSQDVVYGRIESITPERLELELDVPYDLRGWGGAPVLLDSTQRVIGMLQAYYPEGSTTRVIVSPLDSLLAALDRPLERGVGRAFAQFASLAPKRTAQEARDARLPVAPAETLPADALPHASSQVNVQLEIEYPPDGIAISNSACGVFVAGRALALRGEIQRFDVAIVIDTSASTGLASGSDIDGNGEIGKVYGGAFGSVFGAGLTDPADSILAAEVAAARQLMRGLDPRSTRVAVIVFAGEQEQQGGVVVFGGGAAKPAFTVQALTNEYDHVEKALDSVLAQGPAGLTHIAAGVDQATIELMGIKGSTSRKDPTSQKIVLFFTDGAPTLPYGAQFEAENVRAVLRAAGRSQYSDIRIHSFAIGPEALDAPIATVEMARRTGGYFTPVRHPGMLAEAVETVDFANLDEVVVKNSTNGQLAAPFRLTADGTWSGFLVLDEGANQLEVTARADDATTAQATRSVRLDPNAPEVAIPEDLVVHRNRLLEECLRNLKQVRVAAEKDAADKVRKALMVEIEKERALAKQRATEQRKRLELGVEDEAAP